MVMLLLMMMIMVLGVKLQEESLQELSLSVCVGYFLQVRFALSAKPSVRNKRGPKAKFLSPQFHLLSRSQATKVFNGKYL